MMLLQGSHHRLDVPLHNGALNLPVVLCHQEIDHCPHVSVAAQVVPHSGGEWVEREIEAGAEMKKDCLPVQDGGDDLATACQHCGSSKSIRGAAGATPQTDQSVS